MKISGLIISLILAATGPSVRAQQVHWALRVEKGQAIEIAMKLNSVITQEAMGQAIDFTANGTASHTYSVSAVSPETYTLHHTVNRLAFKFDGMGQSRHFDSANEMDRQAEPVSQLLGRTYDIVIDSTGKTLEATPGQAGTPKADERMAIINNMLHDLFAIATPPQKGDGSFFNVLPGTVVKMGESWTDSIEDANGKAVTNYSVQAINDTAIIIHFSGSSQTITKAVMMGNETTTNMNNKLSGAIVVDRQTGLLRRKTTSIESAGSTDVMGGKVPVTSKSTIEITVMAK